MPGTNEQTVIAIAGIAIVLLFLGTLFLTMLIYFNNRKSQLARQNQALRDSFERQLLQARLEVQEHIFKEISGEIHDNVGQLLSLAKVQLNVIDQRNVLDKAMLLDIKSNVSTALADLREIA